MDSSMRFARRVASSFSFCEVASVLRSDEASTVLGFRGPYDVFPPLPTRRKGCPGRRGGILCVGREVKVD